MSTSQVEGRQQSNRDCCPIRDTRGKLVIVSPISGASISFVYLSRLFITFGLVQETFIIDWVFKDRNVF